MRELKDISRRELEPLYRNRFVYDYHNAEQMRPLPRIRELLDLGIYEAAGLYTAENIDAYLFYTRTERLVLLDFFAVDRTLRGKGTGSEALCALSEKYPGLPVVIEVEDPNFAVDERDLETREKRIRFYEKNGFESSALNAILFGEPYRVMTNNGSVGAETLRKSLLELYDVLYTAPVAEKNVKLI